MTYERYSRDHPQVTADGDWNPHLDVLEAISGVLINATLITDDNETATLPSSLRHRNLSGAGDAQLHVPRRHAPTHMSGGIDSIGHDNLSGITADNHHPQIHQ